MYVTIMLYSLDNSFDSSETNDNIIILMRYTSSRLNPMPSTCIIVALLFSWSRHALCFENKTYLKGRDRGREAIIDVMMVKGAEQFLVSFKCQVLR